MLFSAPMSTDQASFSLGEAASVHDATAAYTDEKENFASPSLIAKPHRASSGFVCSGQKAQGVAPPLRTPFQEISNRSCTSTPLSSMGPGHRAAPRFVAPGSFAPGHFAPQDFAPEDFAPGRLAPTPIPCLPESASHGAQLHQLTNMSTSRSSIDMPWNRLDDTNDQSCMEVQPTDSHVKPLIFVGFSGPSGGLSGTGRQNSAFSRVRSVKVAHNGITAGSIDGFHPQMSRDPYDFDSEIQNESMSQAPQGREVEPPRGFQPREPQSAHLGSSFVNLKCEEKMEWDTPGAGFSYRHGSTTRADGEGQSCRRAQIHRPEAVGRCCCFVSSHFVFHAFLLTIMPMSTAWFCMTCFVGFVSLSVSGSVRMRFWKFVGPLAFQILESSFSFSF